MGFEIVRQGGEVIKDELEVDQALFDGNKLHGFVSGGGLVVIRIENQKKELVGYGESIHVEEALQHAAFDYQLGHETYEKQYSGRKSRYTHYWTGSPESNSPLDEHIKRGANIDAKRSPDGHGITAILSGISFPPDIPEGLQSRVVASMAYETFEERGITYQATPSQLPGNGSWGISVKAIDNPNNVSTFSYKYEKYGDAPTFDMAVKQAFEAPEIEVM